MGLFGGSNSIFNNPGQLSGGPSIGTSGFNTGSVFGAHTGGDALANLYGPISGGIWGYLEGQLNQPGPVLQAPPMPPNPSAVAGASLQTDVQQEAQQYSASTLLNGGQGVPFGNQGLMASNILRAGSR